MTAHLLLPWSPVTCLPKASLTASGLLSLDTKDGEVELMHIHSPIVELRQDCKDDDAGYVPQPMTSVPPSETKGEWQTRSRELQLTVTTHRLVFFYQPPSSSSTKNSASALPPQVVRFLHLSNIHQVEGTGGATLLRWNASSKIVLSTYTYGDLILAFTNPNSAALSSSSGSSKQLRDNCLDHVEKALERRAWERAQKLQEKQKTQQRSVQRRVGVDHILAKQKLKHQTAAKLADKALEGDAEQLLHEAAELLQVINKYIAVIQKQQSSSSSSSTSSKESEDQQKLASLLQDMGMTSALTSSSRSGAGGGGGKFRNKRGGNNSNNNTEYYTMLARQLADFLLPKLPTMGGIITLTDVFCLFNRARGSNLISPEDLLMAANILNDDLSELGISQKTFDGSGIVVLQLNSRMIVETDEWKDKIQTLCPTTALEASHSLKVSPVLALEQLQQAEKWGWLCRDTTLETTRFYTNIYFI